MQKYGLMSQLKKLFRNFTNSRHNLPKYPNLIKDLVISTINYVWRADITYIYSVNLFKAKIIPEIDLHWAVEYEDSKERKTGEALVKEKF